jgi:hypothetical protein
LAVLAALFLLCPCGIGLRPRLASGFPVAAA